MPVSAFSVVPHRVGEANNQTLQISILQVEQAVLSHPDDHPQDSL